MKRASRPGVSSRCRPALDRIAAVTDRPGLSRVLGGTLRADVDVLNATTLHTDNLFGLWVAQDLDDPTRYAPFLLQGGLEMPDREYYLDPSARMADIRRAVPGPHRRRAQARARGGRRSQGRPHSRSGAPHRRGRTRAVEDTEDVLKGNNHWASAGLRNPAHPASTGQPSSRPPASTGSPTSWSGSRARSPASPRSWRSQPLDDLEGLPDLPRPRAHRPPSCPRRSPTSTSPSTARCCRGSPQPRDRWKRRGRRDQPGARRGRRQALRAAATSRPARRRAPRRWCATSWPPSAGGSTSSTGWRPRPRPRPRPSSPRSRSASATPTPGATTRGSRSVAATPSATPSGRSCSSTGAT